MQYIVRVWYPTLLDYQFLPLTKLILDTGVPSCERSPFLWPNAYRGFRRHPRKKKVNDILSTVKASTQTLTIVPLSGDGSRQVKKYREGASRNSSPISILEQLFIASVQNCEPIITKIASYRRNIVPQKHLSCKCRK